MATVTVSASRQPVLDMCIDEHTRTVYACAADGTFTVFHAMSGNIRGGR
jgi:hypothetical protein